MPQRHAFWHPSDSADSPSRRIVVFASHAVGVACTSACNTPHNGDPAGWMASNPGAFTVE